VAASCERERHRRKPQSSSRRPGSEVRSPSGPRCASLSRWPAGRQPGRVRRRTLDPRVGRYRRRHRHARCPQWLPAPCRLPLQRLPLHQRPRRRRGRRRPGAQPRPHQQPRRARPPDHPPAHPLRRRPTSRSDTGPTQPPNDCSQHSTLARLPNRQPRPDTADRPAPTTRQRVNFPRWCAVGPGDVVRGCPARSRAAVQPGRGQGVACRWRR
jgi:hypothetical protein